MNGATTFSTMGKIATLWKKIVILLYCNCVITTSVSVITSLRHRSDLVCDWGAHPEAQLGLLKFWLQLLHKNLSWCTTPNPNLHQWSSTFFAFSLIIEVTTAKVLKFIMPLKSIYYKNLGFVEQKMYF